jgi:hypothetical protein
MLRALLNLILVAIAMLLFISIWNSWGPALLLVNTVIALIALKIVGWLGIKIEVNLWSILILLLGGIPGLLVLIFLSVTGLAFRQR